MPVTPDASCFSPDWVAARGRFVSSAIAAGATIETHAFEGVAPDDTPLSIDVARVGPAEAERVVVVSSGLHGVEGFLGSAVQAALLELVLPGTALPDGVAVVLIHALNPYGFAHLRRFDHENIDLNRNFLLPGEPYAGAPEGYAALDGLLNPDSPPTALDPFLLRAAVEIVRHGMPALKDAVAGGQYEFPKGLFFGGSGPSVTQRWLAAHLPGWVSGAARVLHVDVHTGLGQAGYKLLVDHEDGSPGAAQLAEWFGGDVVQPWRNDGVTYTIRGGLGTWCKATMGSHYDVVALEYATVHILRVIAALRAENRAHHFGQPSDGATERAKRELREVFAPSDRAWRDRAVADAVRVVEQAISALSRG